MAKVQWVPKKNTEKTARNKHGEKTPWDVLRQNERGNILIQSPDGKDLRWIEPHQVTEMEGLV